jgi:hypothetical protein
MNGNSPKSVAVKVVWEEEEEAEDESISFYKDINRILHVSYKSW